MVTKAPRQTSEVPCRSGRSRLDRLCKFETHCHHWQRALRGTVRGAKELQTRSGDGREPVYSMNLAPHKRHNERRRQADTWMRKHSLKDTAWTTAQRCKQSPQTRGQSKRPETGREKGLCLEVCRENTKDSAYLKEFSKAPAIPVNRAHAPPQGHRRAGHASSLPGRRCHEDSDEQATPPLSRTSAATRTATSRPRLLSPGPALPRLRTGARTET